MKLDLRQLEARGQRSATIDAEVVRSWSTSLGLEPKRFWASERDL